MIKVEKKGNSIETIIKGETADIVTESINVIRNVSMELAETIEGEITNKSIEGILYGLIMCTIDDLNKEGYKIDLRKIGLSMITAHDIVSGYFEGPGRNFFKD